MENRPIRSFTGTSPAPMADAGVFGRYQKWAAESRPPVVMHIPEVVGLDSYQIVRESPEYPKEVSVSHYRSLKDWRASAASPERKALGEDFQLWIERGVIDYIWSAVYALVNSFRAKPAFSSGNEDTRIENAPIMYFQAYRLSQEEHEKYVKWLNEYGCPIFMPLFMKLPGLMGYDSYEYTGLRLRDYIRELGYPRYISIVYFENLKAYEDFIKSPELSGFQKAMRSVFPFGLNYQWHVQYQLIRSWRK